MYSETRESPRKWPVCRESHSHTTKIDSVQYVRVFKVFDTLDQLHQGRPPQFPQNSLLVDHKGKHVESRSSERVGRRLPAALTSRLSSWASTTDLSSRS